jgi:hypothetical protein
MAAGIESAVDTRTYNSPSLVGNIVEKVLIARQLAENERKFAEKKAAEAGTSLEEVGIEKGFFFKKALKGEFGGNFVDKKTKQLKGVVKKYKIAKRISKNPKVAFNFIKPILAAKTSKKVSGAQTKMFRAKFDYTNYDEVTTAVPKTPVAGVAPKKIQKATTSKSKRISREELLSSITEIANSLNKTAESIGRSTSGVSSSVISASNAQMQLVEQLKVRNTTLEDKLNEIAKAISEQTQFQRQSVSRSKAAKAEERLENQADVSTVETPDDTATAENETLIAQLSQNITPTTNIVNAPTIERPSGGYPSFSDIPKAGMDIPQAERGGIISGPDSGYLAKLHGDELVVPLRNNYTEGKKSAVDGKVRRRPSSISSGGVTKSSLGGRFGFGITNMAGIAGGGSTQASALSQPIVDAMSLIPMAVGGGTLAQLTSLMNVMGNESPIIQPYIQQVSRSLANVFGLPNAIVNKVKSKSAPKGEEGTEDKEEGESKKDLLSKLMDGFGKLLEKMGQAINSPATTTTTGSGDLSAVNLEGLSEKEISDLGRMVYAEAGASEEGAAHVLNAILNRYRQVKQGKATPQAWGVRSGVTAEQMTITDLLYAENQFQPIRDKRFDKVSAEQGTQALNAAIKGGGLNPSEIKSKAMISGMTEEEAARLAVADTFYNPTVSSNKPFKDAPVVNTSNKHAFMSSPNTGFKPEDLSRLQPVVQTPPPIPPQPVSQQIQQNFGMNPNDKVEFVLGDKTYEAYKTTQGFDFFEVTANPLDSNPKVTNPEKLKILTEAFVKLKSQPSAPPPKEVSFNPPSAASQAVAKAQQISQPLDTSGAGNIVAMMMPQSQEAKTASTSLPSSAQTSTTGRSSNPLGGSGLYEENYNLV